MVINVSKNLIAIIVLFVLLVLLYNSNMFSSMEGFSNPATRQVQHRMTNNKHAEYLDPSAQAPTSSSTTTPTYDPNNLNVQYHSPQDTLSPTTSQTNMLSMQQVDPSSSKSFNENGGWQSQFNNDLAGSNVPSNASQSNPEGNFVANNAAVSNLADFNQTYDSSLIGDNINGDNINDVINQKSQQQLTLNNADLLPQDVNQDWFMSDFSNARIKVNEQNILDANNYVVGINTVGSSLKNPSYDIRKTIPNIKSVVSPWNNSVIDPDFNTRGIE